jgi:hypothetical protein
MSKEDPSPWPGSGITRYYCCLVCGSSWYGGPGAGDCFVCGSSAKEEVITGQSAARLIERLERKRSR